MQVLSLTGKGFQMILPVNMVAQILGRAKLSGPKEPGGGYVMGDIAWRDFRVPLCGSGHLLGYDPAADQDYERVVVLWPLKSAHSSAFIGLTSLTAPRVVDISDPDTPQQSPKLDFALDYVMIDGELAVIPDIERLSGMLYADKPMQK